MNTHKNLIQRCCLVVFTTICLQTLHAQNEVYYTLDAKAKALMCPFLSPQLMNLLTEKGAKDVYKDEDLRLHFHTPRKEEMSDDYILEMVEHIGYDANIFTVYRTYDSN